MPEEIPPNVVLDDGFELFVFGLIGAIAGGLGMAAIGCFFKLACGS